MQRTQQVPRSDVYLIQAAIDESFFVSVVSEDEILANTRYHSKSTIEKVLGDLDEALLVFHSPDGQYQGSACVVYDYGQRPEEIIADYSTGLWVETVMEAYWKKYIDIPQ